MQSGLRFNLMSPGSLRRGIVVFLLAFAFFDLAVVDLFFPQLCGDGQASHSLAGPGKSIETAAVDKSTGKIAPELAPFVDHGSQPVQDSHQSPVDEDCFCCCSHVIPSSHVNVAAFNYPPQLDDQAITPLPLPPPHGPFRPPRLS
jgi:hypothetical protein